jgi:membrane protease YdiL (CAAX protease family)
MMQENEMLMAEDAEKHKKPKPIASWLHLAGFLLIGAGVTGMGFLAQHGHAGGGAGNGQLASHGIAIQVYLTAIFLDWALFYYCWAGVHRRGASLWSLSGGRWTSWKSAAADIGIVLPFWGVWEGAAYGVARLLGPSGAKTVDSLLPKSLPEVLLWIATAITAGVCEEMVFRGYLQRQFHALGGGIAAAVVAQGLVFGLFHSYQGWRNVAVIFVLGILYGTLAAWRGNLCANIIAHAWSDIWEGWLKFLVLR